MESSTSTSASSGWWDGGSREGSVLLPAHILGLYEVMSKARFKYRWWFSIGCGGERLDCSDSACEKFLYRQLLNNLRQASQPCTQLAPPLLNMGFCRTFGWGGWKELVYFLFHQDEQSQLRLIWSNLPEYRTCLRYLYPWSSVPGAGIFIPAELSAIIIQAESCNLCAIMGRFIYIAIKLPYSTECLGTCQGVVGCGLPPFFGTSSWVLNLSKLS